MKKCDDCQGQGKIELFTSWAECEKCGGTGEVGGSNDLSEERYSIQWDEAKDFTIIDTLDQDDEAVSSRRPSRPIQTITGRSAGIEPPLENTFKRTYGTNSERTRLFRDDLAQAEQRIMRQMVRALRLNEEDVNNEED